MCVFFVLILHRRNQGAECKVNALPTAHSQYPVQETLELDQAVLELNIPSPLGKSGYLDAVIPFERLKFLNEGSVSF